MDIRGRRRRKREAGEWGRGNGDGGMRWCIIAERSGAGQSRVPGRSHEGYYRIRDTCFDTGAGRYVRTRIALAGVDILCFSCFPTRLYLPRGFYSFSSEVSQSVRIVH